MISDNTFSGGLPRIAFFPDMTIGLSINFGYFDMNLIISVSSIVVSFRFKALYSSSPFLSRPRGFNFNKFIILIKVFAVGGSSR